MPSTSTATSSGASTALEWSIVGYLDIKDESGDTIDVKVGAKHMGAARAESDRQPRVYALARRTEGRAEGSFLLHSIRRDSLGRPLPGCASAATAARLAAIEWRIAQTALQLSRCAEARDWPLSTLGKPMTMAMASVGLVGPPH